MSFELLETIFTDSFNEELMYLEYFADSNTTNDNSRDLADG